jgi:hypothetical protein
VPPVDENGTDDEGAEPPEEAPDAGGLPHTSQ